MSDNMCPNPMLHVKYMHDSRENAELRRENQILRERIETLENLLSIVEITRIFEELSTRSVYRIYFTGQHRGKILAELIARYNFTQVDGSVDRSIVIRILNKIGGECKSGLLKSINGDIIFNQGG